MSVANHLQNTVVRTASRETNETEGEAVLRTHSVLVNAHRWTRGRAHIFLGSSATMDSRIRRGTSYLGVIYFKNAIGILSRDVCMIVHVYEP